MAGLDPMEGWERTPGELLEYIDACEERLERNACLLYDLAVCIAEQCFSKRPRQPAFAFPGFIRYRPMTEDELLASCMAWANLRGEDGHGSGQTE